MTLFRRTASVTLGLVCISVLAGLGRAQAASILPISYRYTNGTSAGAGDQFSDSGFTELTDGLTGTTNYADGTWVGWPQNAVEQITFTFAASVTITDVSIEFLRDNQHNIEVPVTVQINSSSPFSPSNFSSDSTKGFIDFSGSWTGTQLVLNLDNGNEWNFLNEVTFSSADSTAPEPGTVGLALAGLVALVGLGRKRSPFSR